MATVSFFLTVAKPSPLNAGLQLITGNINCIMTSNPGPEATNTPYNGVSTFSYTPTSIANLQFNNAVPSAFVAATTAHGGATLVGETLTIGLYNGVAQSKPFQVQDTAPPGAPSGTILQGAIVTYPVTAAAPTPAAPVPTFPVLPGHIYFCWRGNSNPIVVTDPDVTAATINLTTFTFSAQIDIDTPGSVQTLYTSPDGTTWTPAAGSPWTVGSGSVATSIGVATPTAQVTSAAFTVSGTLGGYTAAPTLQYQDDAGAFAALPTGASVTATTFSFTQPGLAAGSHTITVRDANATGVTATTNAFAVATPVVPSLNVITPAQQPAGGSFAVSGTIGGYSAAPTLNYRDDAGSYIALPSGAVVTATTFLFTNPGLAAGAHSVGVRDANNTATAVTTGSFNVVAPATPVITVSVPSLPVALTPFTVTGTLANYASAPSLTYSDDGALAVAVPVGSTVSTTAFSFIHPGLTTGNHTTVISDGSQSGTVSYSVTAAVAGGASPDGTVVTTTAGSITDSATNRYTLTSGNQVAINGAIDLTTTGTVVELAWVGGVVYYENSSGLWFTETSPTGPWTPPSGTLTSPLAVSPTMIVNGLAIVAPNATFVVTGSLNNYTAVPTLTFSDDSGPATAFPAGSTVTLTGFSFTHLGETTGIHALLISDGTRSQSVSYAVGSSSFVSLPSQSGLNAIIAGLTPGTSYDIDVYAENSVGEGTPSAILTVSTAGIVIALPAAPTGLSDAGVTQTAVNLFWVAGAGGAPATSYGTRWSLTGANSWTAGPVTTVTNAQITGLSSGVTYDFEVWAINAGGVGPFSSILTVATSSAVAATVTWQPQGAGASLAFSNGNLTATAGGSTTVGAQRQAVVSTSSIASGKASFEVTLTAVTTSVAVGLANATASLGARLGADANSIGLYVGNIPATTATASISGLPQLGMSCMLTYPEGNGFNGDQSGANDTWLGTQKYLCTPRTMEVFPGSWVMSDITYYLGLKAAAWKADPYFNGTNAGGIPTIPIMGIPLTTTDGGVTLATLAAGQSSAYFTTILTAWANAGYKRILVRLCWEDNYPTTSSGQGASPGSNYPSGSYCPWSFYGSANNYASYCAAFIAGWRVAAHTLHTVATSLGINLTVGWGPTLIDTCYIDPRRCYPDSVQTDGLGKQVDAHFPDCYFGNFYGNVTSMHSGYNSPPFTNFAVTGQAANIAAFAADTGSEFFSMDYFGGQRYIAPPATPTTPLGWSGGWGLYESMVFCLQQGCSMFMPEYGGLSTWDGTNYVSEGAKQNGTQITGSGTGAANEIEMAAWIRPRISWFQDKTQNGIANGTFLGWAWWQNQSLETMEAVLAVFPEFGSNPDAGQGTSGTATTTTARTAPQTVHYNNTDVLVPSGNQPAADAAGDTISVCFDATAGLFWATSPAMRSAYGATAWNDSATANPGTGVGGVPFTIAGSLAACFDTAEGGAVAVLNAGSSPFLFSGMPSNFPALQGAPPVVVAPGQVTGLAYTAASLSIAVPASIPAQKSGQEFSLVAAFNYVPIKANLFYSPLNGGFPTTAIGGTSYSPFSQTPPNAPYGAIVWDATNTIATLTFELGSITNWTFQVVDNTPGAVVTSAAIPFTTTTATSGGGTVTATAAAPNTNVVLKWTAPATGSGPFTYIIEQSPTGAGTYTIVGSSTTTSVSIPGLPHGIAYDYVVYAANGAGNGTQSTAVTYTIPGAPAVLVPNPAMAVSVSGATQSSLSLSWQAATTGPTVTGYQVQYQPTGSSTYVNYSPTTVSQQQVISGLSANTGYSFVVIAFNASGNAAASVAATGTTLAIPTQPTTTGPLLTLLTSLSGTGSISGEYIGPGPITPINTIDTLDGQFLGLIGGDYWTPGTAGAAVTTFNAIAETYWLQGGMVLLNTSIPNPTTGGAATDISSLTATSLLTAGTATNTNFVNSLSQIATGLAALQAAGVSVIFRPFAQANAGTFWWGTGVTTTSLTAAQFVAMWQYVWSYMTATKGLNNLVWLYSALSPFSTYTQALTRYPGAQYVDITGLELFTSLPVTVTVSDVITVSSIPSPVAGSTFSMTGTGSLAWTSAAAVQVSFGATKALVGAQATGYTVTLSNSNLTAVVTGLIAPVAGNYVAYMADSGAGVTSAGVGYVVSAKAAAGSVTSIAGLPYLGWGIELSYPQSGYTTNGIDNATLAMTNWIANFCKPTTMLMYGGSFANFPSQQFGVTSYLNTWIANTSYNGTLLGYKLVPILGISMTGTDGTSTCATVIAGTNDAQIQACMQAILTAGYTRVVLRISWEDNYPTCPSGMGASNVAGYGQYQGAVVNGISWQFYGATNSGSSTLGGLPTGTFNYCDSFIKAWRRMAHVVQQFADANGMTIWKVWGPTLTSSCNIDPRLMYPDQASYQAADGWGKLVDVHGPDMYLGNLYGALTALKTGYQNNSASAPFNGNYGTTGTAASTAAFAADIGSEYYWLDFTGGGGPAQTNSWTSNPATPLPWSGGWGTFESMVFALQQNCMWTIPEFSGTEGASATIGGKNNGTNIYGTSADYPNYPEFAAYLRPRFAWFQSEALNKIYNGVILQVSFWSSSAGLEELQAFATEFPEFATNSGNNPQAGNAGVIFPAPT